MRAARWALAAGLAAISVAATADTVRLAGSQAVLQAVIVPQREKLEKASGQQLQVVSNGSGKGLADLAEHNADIAMISAPLELALAAAEAAGRKIDPAMLKVHELRSEEVVFLANAGNPVGRLTQAQLADLYTGKVGNWKQVGGKDQAITIYTTAPSTGTSAVVKKALGGDPAPGAKTMLSFTRLVDFLPSDEGGLGAVGRSFVRSDGKTRVIDSPRMVRPLALVTWGEPTGKVKQLLDVLRGAAGGGATDIASLCPTQVKPEIPRKALQDGVEGTVHAQALIRNGVVKEVAILSGPRVFHSAVREAMLQYKCAADAGEVTVPQEFVFRTKSRD